MVSSSQDSPRGSYQVSTLRQEMQGNLPLSPTKCGGQSAPRVDDFGVKGSITPGVSDAPDGVSQAGRR